MNRSLWIPTKIKEAKLLHITEDPVVKKMVVKTRKILQAKRINFPPSFFYNSVITVL
jgi:hypothetical protein